VVGCPFGYLAEVEESDAIPVSTSRQRDEEVESPSGTSEGGCLKGILRYGASRENGL
jgi:hypothetical protein